MVMRSQTQAATLRIWLQSIHHLKSSQHISRVKTHFQLTLMPNKKDQIIIFKEVKITQVLVKVQATYHIRMTLSIVKVLEA